MSICMSETSTTNSSGMRARRGDDLDRVDGRVDEAAVLGDGRGLALEAQRHGDGDLLVEVDLEEVDVGDGAAHRVALQVLDDRRVHRAVDGEVEHGVDAGGAGQGEAQVAAADGDATAASMPWP